MEEGEYFQNSIQQQALAKDVPIWYFVLNLGALLGLPPLPGKTPLSLMQAKGYLL